MALVYFAEDLTQQISCIIKPSAGNKGGLYLGNAKAAKNLELLKSHKITAIISIISQPLEVTLPLKSSHHLKINIEDSPLENIERYFDKSNEFIEKHLQNGNIFVHCYAGISRSATLVICYLMKKRRLSLNHATYKVKSRRSIIKPNKGFINQLKVYEKSLINNAYKLK